MRRLMTAAAALIFGATAAVAADPQADGLKKGKVPVKSVSALAVGPTGVLFIGDSQSGSVFAVDTGDTKSTGQGDVNIEKLADTIGSALGTTAENVAINDVKVNPTSGNIFLAVTRGKGKDASPVVVKLDRAGKFSIVEMTDIPYAAVSLPNASEKQRTLAITSMAFVDGKLYVAGLSSEEFASTFRMIPYPFQSADKIDKGTAVEIYHGAHGAVETRSPIRTFVAYKIGANDNILAAYTCTPLVKLPVADLKPGTKVRGTTIAELGNRNNPLDMVVYNKEGKDYVLIANTARGVMKVPADQFAAAEGISSRIADTAGVKYETIKELEGVVQLDKLDNNRALLLIAGKDKSLTLKSVPLP